jgi:hypothetical protein
MSNKDNKILSSDNQHSSTDSSYQSHIKKSHNPAKSKPLDINKNFDYSSDKQAPDYDGLPDYSHPLKALALEYNNPSKIINPELQAKADKIYQDLVNATKGLCKSTQPESSCSTAHHIEEPKSIDDCDGFTLACKPLPPKPVKDFSAKIQVLKALNIERARLLAHSTNKRAIKLSRDLFQCCRNVRITKSGKPLHWQCRSRFCHICNHFKQHRYIKNFERNLTQSRYNPYGWKMVTLTLKNVQVEDLAKAITLLNTSFRKIVRRKPWRDSVEGSIKAIEYPREMNNPLFFNVHAHVLIATNDSIDHNKLFHTNDNGFSPALSKIWKRYTGAGVVLIKNISKRRPTVKDFPWIKPNQITPDELADDVIRYLAKNEQTDLSEHEHHYPTKHTFDFITQIKGSRLFSCSGTLSGYLSDPPKRKLSDEEKEAIAKQYSPSNILKTYQYHPESKRYKLIDESYLMPHFESWLIFKYKSFHLSEKSRYLDDLDNTHRIKDDIDFSLNCRHLDKKCKDDS